MRERYKILGHSLGKYRCVSLNETDHTLAGERGEIWQCGPTTLRAIQIDKFRENEKIISFDIKDLDKWVIKLKIPRHPQDQLVWANNPNSRFK